MLEPTLLIGLGLVALWAYCRYPARRPKSLMHAVAHVAISFLGFVVLPYAVGFLVRVAHTHALQVGVVLALLIPMLTYVLLSLVWLIARILNDLLRGPRGGHPVATEH